MAEQLGGVTVGLNGYWAGVALNIYQYPRLDLFEIYLNRKMNGLIDNQPSWQFSTSSNIMLSYHG
jgi:hypothetical protein